MICKGHARGNGGQMAAYLADYLKAEKNARVEVLEITGSQFPDMHRTFLAWESEAQRTRAQKPFWHAQIVPTPGEILTREQQLEAVSILERHHGLQGQPRAVVLHEKHDGSEHLHVVWSRTDRATGKTRRDDYTHRKNCAAAREMEDRFGLHRIETPQFRDEDRTKSRRERREESKQAPNRHDYQKAARSGLHPAERKRIITKCWRQSDCGKAFRSSLQENDYILAHGDRRDFVVVDKTGDVHSLARQVTGARAADIRARLSDIDPASIPKAAHVQAELRAAKREASGDPVRPRPRPQKASAENTDSAQAMDAPGAESKAKRNPLDPQAILDDITQHQSTFTRTDLDREIYKRLEVANNPFGQDTIDALRHAVRALPDFVSLGKDRADRLRFTSRDMLNTELLMRTLSDQLSTQRNHAVAPDIRDKAPSASKLGDEQKAAFHHVTSDAGIGMVVGYAGTGKSTMLGAAREAWEAAGYRVRGTSVSSMAASSLEKGSGIRSRTLASTLWRLENVAKADAELRGLNADIDACSGRTDQAKRRKARMQAERDRKAAQVSATRLTSRDIVVVDEAGMVGSRQLTALLTEVRQAGAKAVLVGDAEQLQAIDAGGCFRALSERHGAVEISEIRRQKEEWQKQATRDFAQSFTDEALEAYRSRGYVHERKTQAEARKEMVEDWTKSRAANPDKTHLMMAFTRADVHELNQAARAAYRAEGRFTSADHEIGTAQGKRDFTQGDRIYFLKNDLRLNVMNGSLGTLETIKQSRIDKSKFELTVGLDDGGKVTFRTADYNHFAHGYASTVHRAQGATIDKAQVLASGFMDRHAAYVGMSRHRERADMYYGSDEFKNFGTLVRTLSRDRRKDTTLDYLDRAEKAGQPERFWDRVKRIAAPKPSERKRPAETIIDKIVAKRAAKATQASRSRAAEELRGILGSPPVPKRKPKRGISF